jgi:hypothetical protein
MSILKIIAHVKEHRIPGTFDCISKNTNLQYYVYMQVLFTVVMLIVCQLVQINALKLERNETCIFL